MKPFTFDRFVRLLLSCAVVAALLYLLSVLSGVLLPFFVGGLLAYLLYPIVRFVQTKMRVRNRTLSILITLIVVAAVIYCIAYLIIPPMVDQIERLGYLIKAHLSDGLGGWGWGNDESKSLRMNRLYEWLRENSESLVQTMEKVLPKIYEGIRRAADIVFGVVASLMALIYMFFILLDYETIGSGIIKLAPKRNRPFWQALISDVEHEMNCYMRGQAFVALCIGVLMSIGLTIVGFPVAIALGILIGILSLIPYLHAIAIVPMVFLALLKAADTGQNFWLILISGLAVFAVVQVISDTILTPKIMGKVMRLNPAILLLSLSVWGYLLGFIGLIIALPLTTLIIAYYRRYITKDTENDEQNE